MSKSVELFVGSTLLLLDSTRNNRKGDSLSQSLTLTQIATPVLISTIHKSSQTLSLSQSVKVIAPIYVHQTLNLNQGPQLNFSFHKTLSQALELNHNLKRNKTGFITDFLNLRQSTDFRVFAQTLTFIQTATVVKINPNSQSLSFTETLDLIKLQGHHPSQELIFYSYARVYKPDWRFIGGIYP